jgi:hypothetical protein
LNLKKYVISDDHLTFYEMPSLKDYYDKFGYSFKTSVEDYLTKKGHNITALWEKIDKAVVQLFLNSEDFLTREASKTFSTKSFLIILFLQQHLDDGTFQFDSSLI